MKCIIFQWIAPSALRRKSFMADGIGHHPSFLLNASIAKPIAWSALNRIIPTANTGHWKEMVNPLWSARMDVMKMVKGSMRRQSSIHLKERGGNVF